MYQIKFLKPLTLSRNPLVPAKYKPKPNDPAYELTSTITVTNDLGEQFFFGNMTLTLQARYYASQTPDLAYGKFSVIGQTEEKWTSGKRALEVRIPISMKSAPAGGFISVFAFVDPKIKTSDGMGYDQTTTEELIQETLDGLDVSLFKGCEDTECFKTDGVSFLPTLTDLLQMPKTFAELPVKTERVAIRSISEMLLYEELSGSIARHLWDAGVLVSTLETKALLKFLSLDGRTLCQQDRLNILELGTGIGLVGVHLGQTLTNSSVLVTDLEDAEEICGRNIALNGSQKTVSFSELDWESPTKHTEHWDVIVTTDCTYNPLYYDALITVLRRECEPSTVVVLAHKFREPFSESEFFAKVGAHFTLRRQQWHSHGQTLIHLGLYTIIRP